MDKKAKRNRFCAPIPNSAAELGLHAICSHSHGIAPNPKPSANARTLMECIDLELPLDPSGLGKEEMAHRFHYATNGYLGWIMHLIRHAAHLAIVEHCSTLNRALLQHSYDACIAGTVMAENKINPFSLKHF